MPESLCAPPTFYNSTSNSRTSMKVFVFTVLAAMLICATFGTEVCPPEGLGCQDGFSKVNETSNTFICQSPLASEWKGSFYTVYNETNSNYHISLSYTSGPFKNEVEVSAIVIRACISKNSYFTTKIRNPEGSSKYASLGMFGTGEYNDYVFNASTPGRSGFNGTVQQFSGAYNFAWIGSQVQPTINMAISKFIKY